MAEVLSTVFRPPMYRRHAMGNKGPKLVNYTIGDKTFNNVPQSRVLTHKQRVIGMAMGLEREVTPEESKKAFHEILAEPRKMGGAQYLESIDKRRIHNLFRQNIGEVNKDLLGKLQFNSDGDELQYVTQSDNGKSTVCELVIFCRKIGERESGTVPEIRK